MAVRFHIDLEFGNVGIWGEGKTRVPGEKHLGAKARTNSKLNPHNTPSSGIEPGPHCGRRVLSPLRHSCFPMLHHYGYILILLSKARRHSHSSQFSSRHCPLSELPKHCYHDSYTFWRSIYNLSTSRATKYIRSRTMLSCCCVHVQCGWFQWLSTLLREEGTSKNS